MNAPALLPLMIEVSELKRTIDYQPRSGLDDFKSVCISHQLPKPCTSLGAHLKLANPPINACAPRAGFRAERSASGDFLCF